MAVPRSTDNQLGLTPVVDSQRVPPLPSVAFDAGCKLLLPVAGRPFETRAPADATLLATEELVLDELATDDAGFDDELDGADDLLLDDELTGVWQAALVPQSQTMSSIAISKAACGSCPSTLVKLNSCDMDCNALIPRISAIGIVAWPQSPLRTKP